MQIPCALYFGPKHSLETRPILIAKDGIIERPSSMHNAAELRRKFTSNGSNRRFIGDVQQADIDARSSHLDLAHDSASFVTGCAAPDKNQVATSALRHPLGNTET